MNGRRDNVVMFILSFEMVDCVDTAMMKTKRLSLCESLRKSSKSVKRNDNAKKKKNRRLPNNNLAKRYLKGTR